MMTHPTPLPLEQTPVFASMLNDSRFGDLARQFLQPDPRPIHHISHSSYPRRSVLACWNHPENCHACSTASLEFSMTNPRPPANRGLALPPGSSTVKPTRVTRPKKRSR